LLVLWMLGTIAAAFVVTREPQLLPVVLAAGVVAILVSRRPVLLAAVSVPAALVVTRVGPGGAVSLGQAATALAAAFAIPVLLRRPMTPAFSIGLRVAVGYAAVVAIVLLAHPSETGASQLAHRTVIVVGGLLVGAWLVQEGEFERAFSWLIIGTSVLGVVAIWTAIQTDGAPAYPWVYHKNFVGSITATCLLVLLTARRRLPLPTWAVGICSAALLGGLLASRSRGGMTALGVGVLVWVLAGLLVGQTKKVKAALAAAAVGLVFAIQSLLDELRTRPDDPFSSVAVRRAFNEASLQLWQEHPFLGVGIHYWRDRYFLKRAFEGGPVNVVAEHLAEGGVVALVGFVALVVGMLVALSQARSDLAATAAAVLVARVAHGTVDIYWVAVQTSVTFVVVGAALADTTGRRATETGEAVRLPWSRPRAVLDAPQRARA
jgi:hypothetical protein